MNTLSWILYVADVLPGLSLLLTAVGGILTVSVAVVPFVLYMIRHDEASCYGGKREERAKTYLENHTPWEGLKYAWIPFVLVLFSALVPQKETFYLIAASEIGQAAVQSEVGQEMLEDIHEVIQLQIENLRLSVED
jgi:hypothetical protein